MEKDTTNMALIQRTVQNLPTQVRGKLVNNALKLMREASFPYRKLMAYYTCAMMEVFPPIRPQPHQCHQDPPEELRQHH